MTKYGFDFEKTAVSVDNKRLINQMWKLIPMREKNEDWQAQLIIVIEEIAGLKEIYNAHLDFLVLLSKLEGLTSNVCEDFMIYRKTVFRCIELLDRLLKNV